MGNNDSRVEGNRICSECHTYIKESLTCHVVPEQSQGAWDDNQWLSHSPGAECRCSPGCSRPVLPQLCPSAAEPAAASSCRRGTVTSETPETSETTARKNFQKCTCTDENQLYNLNKLGQQASRLSANKLLSCKLLQSHTCRVFHSPPLQATSTYFIREQADSSNSIF